MVKRQYNLRRDEKDERDYKFAKYVEENKLKIDRSKIPPEADLRPGYTKIKNQLNLGACTAFSACSVMEYLFGGKDNLSELFFYYMERADQGTINEDSGCSIRQSGLTAKHIGACDENLWRYDPAKFAVAPPPEAVNDASKHTIKAFYKIDEIEEILYCIGVLKRPVLIGTDVYDSFETVGNDGKIPMPNTNVERLLGGHAINLCGYFWAKPMLFNRIPVSMRIYNFFKKLFGKNTKASEYDNLWIIVRNSWGEGFADHGYMYMPASFLFKHTYDWQYFDVA